MIPQALIDIQSPVFHSFILLISFAVLYFGADFALGSAEKIGKAVGISPLVVGLLIVGFGTSLPEFFVSHLACISGSYGIALGNVIGSNVANIFLIMGAAALIYPLSIRSRDIFKQLKRHLGLMVLLLVVMQFSRLNWITALALLGFFIYYLHFTFKKMEKGESHQDEERPKLTILDGLKLLLGFFLLYAGGELLVTSGTRLGEIFSISPYVISAIFVAFGTSFPELMTALVACIKKKDVDLITGNVIGSNIFNVAFVMGSFSFYNISLPSKFMVELITLVLISCVLIIMTRVKPRLDRLVGIAFLCCYLGMVFFWIQS